MKVVLDASVAIATILGMESGSAALDTLERASVVIAPEMFIAEVTSGLWKYVIARQLTGDQAAENLGNAIRLVERYHPLSELAQEVLRESALRKHSVYDLFYAVLARREGAILLTIDARLRKLAGQMGVDA